MNNEGPLNLVTGGSGYFGSLLVRRLVNEGRKVRVLDLLDMPNRLPGVEIYRGDIRDAEACRRACEGVNTVFHSVAQVPLAKDKHLFWSVNCDGTRLLLEAARNASVRKVIHLSSSAVYGVPREAPITEKTPTIPAEEYGAAKLAGEAICLEEAQRGLDVTILRPRTILGHGRLGIMQIIFEWVFRGRNVYVLGKGDNRYQFLHADDLTDACITASNIAGPGIYNIGTDRFGTMRETLMSLTIAAKTGSQVRSLPRRPAVAAMKLTGRLGLAPLAAYHALVYGSDVYFDLTPARRDLGFQPRWSNNEMFLQSYQWYISNRDQILKEKGRSPHQSAVREGVLKMASLGLMNLFVNAIEGDMGP